MKTQRTPEARIITALEKIAQAEKAKSLTLAKDITEAHQDDLRCLANKHLKGHISAAKLKKAKIKKENEYRGYSITAQLAKGVSIKAKIQGDYARSDAVIKLEIMKSRACQKAAYAQQATIKTSCIRQIKSYLRNLYGQRSDLSDVLAKELMTSVEDYILKVITPATCPR